ncbi:hypothetical protein D3C73_587000 [compost metagenome]
MDALGAFDDARAFGVQFLHVREGVDVVGGIDGLKIGNARIGNGRLVVHRVALLKIVRSILIGYERGSATLEMMLHDRSH